MAEQFNNAHLFFGGSNICKDTGIVKYRCFMNLTSSAISFSTVLKLMMNDKVQIISFYNSLFCFSAKYLLTFTGPPVLPWRRCVAPPLAWCCNTYGLVPNNYNAPSPNTICKQQCQILVSLPHGNNTGYQLMF